MLLECLYKQWSDGSDGIGAPHVCLPEYRKLASLPRTVGWPIGRGFRGRVALVKSTRAQPAESVAKGKAAPAPGARKPSPAVTPKAPPAPSIAKSKAKAIAKTQTPTTKPVTTQAAATEVSKRTTTRAPARTEIVTEIAPTKTVATQPRLNPGFPRPAVAKRGQVIDRRWRLDALVSVGPFSEVWAAVDQRKGVYAKPFVKIAATTAQREALRKEADLLYSAKGPNLVRLISDHDVPGLGLALVLANAGMPWSDKFRRGPPSVAELIGYAMQIAKGLDRLHRISILHLDVKPENLAVDDAGVARLLDLGVSARGRMELGLHGEPTVFVERNGGLTNRYAAPEHRDPHRGMGKAADQYSLALTILAVLEGKMAAGALPVERGSGVLSEARNRVLTKALSLDPKMRYSSCGGFLRALLGAG